MFEKIKKTSVDKVSRDLMSKTEKLADSISDAVDSLGKNPQKPEKMTQSTEKTVKMDNNGNDKLNIDVEVIGQEKEEFINIDFDEAEQKHDKSPLDYIREELRERSAEKQDLKDALRKEEMRLAAAREKAKRNNALRKIKLVDNVYSKKEIARDEQALNSFKIAEQKKIDEARAERRKEIARKNKKPIAVTLAGILAVCFTFCGISAHTQNVAKAKDYDYAVSCILSEQYSEAADTLYGLNYDDSEALYDYAYAQSRIDSYQGRPENMLSTMSWIDDMENEEVKSQYNETCKELKLADEIQDEIDSIDLTSADDISEDKLVEIEKLSENLDERYKAVLSLDSYELATRVLYNIENNTDAGKLISDIDNLGDITLDSKDKIEGLKKAYSKLSKKDKETILNYSLLTSAEKKYREIKAKDDARIAAEKKAEEERIAAEKKAEEERLEKEAEEARLAAEASQEQMVWVSAKGNCYHSRSSCSNMKNPWQVPLSQAKKTKRACKKCF